MDAANALARIEQMANASGRLEKQMLLTEFMEKELGKFIIKWTYDPFITYGVKLKKMPKLGEPGVMQIDDTLVRVILSQLSTRFLTGNAARDALTDLLEALDAPSRLILQKIIEKDLKAGIAASTIEAVVPGYLPSFGVMRAHPYEQKRVTKFPVPVEPKLDGMRCTFIAKDGKGAFFTRSGKAIDALQHLAQPLLDAARKIRFNADTNMGEFDAPYLELADYLYDLGAEQEPSFVLDTEAMNGLFSKSGALRRKGEQVETAELHAFDILPYVCFMSSIPYTKPWEERRQLLEIFASEVRAATDAPVFVTEIYEANSHEEIDVLYERMVSRTLANYLARGDAELEAELEKITVDDATGELKCLEGAMVKTYDGAYEKRKTHTWLKLKPEETLDLFINGFFQGEANSENEHRMGGAIFDHKGVDVRVGGGWKSHERDELWEDWCHDAAILGIDPNVGFKPGFRLDPAQIHGRGFKLLGRMGEIKFNEVTPDGSLRHPRIIRFRDDKAGEALKEAA